jgi:hypothetical protein
MPMSRPLLTCAFAVALLLAIGSAPLGAQRVGPGREPATTSPAASQKLGEIDGVVTDTLLRPVARAEVVVFRTDIRLETNAEGRFRFVDVPAGQYLIIVRRVGYRPTSAVVQVGASETLRLAYALEPVVTQLESVVVREDRVSLRMLDFERRRKQGHGFFITQEQIERRNLPVSLDYLRLAPSIALAPSHNSSGLSEYVAISKREGGSFSGDGAGACAMQIVVDNVPMPRRFPLEMLPPTRDLAGIEVYAGAASVPQEFSGLDRRCGMIVVWTRDGY